MEEETFTTYIIDIKYKIITILGQLCEHTFELIKQSCHKYPYLELVQGHKYEDIQERFNTVYQVRDFRK